MKEEAIFVTKINPYIMKKIFVFAAAITFAVAVISCGQKAAETPAAEETPAVEAPAADTVAAPATDTTAVAADTTAAH
jgi:hypothetical protein